MSFHQKEKVSRKARLRRGQGGTGAQSGLRPSTSQSKKKRRAQKAARASRKRNR